MPAVNDQKYMVQCGWDDVPHLDAKTKARLRASAQPHTKEAREHGSPSLSAGAIYPITQEEFVCKPFELPAYWPRVFALDVGWKRTACLWGAWDRSIDCLYLYTEHYRGKADPSTHATAIKARGDWIPGVIDPAARGRSQKDGERLAEIYKDLGLKLALAVNARDAGIQAVWELLVTGRLKVFSTLQYLLAEHKLYRRDEDGAIIKEFDHAMDCFHPDTLVWTDRGKLPIRDLPETGMVLTVGGRYAPYNHCGVVNRDVPVIRVGFSDGTSVVCTPDHKFLTPSGWVRADELEGKSCYDAVSKSINRANPCKLPSYRKLFRSLMVNVTTFAGNTSSAMAYAFTALCGRLTTEGRCQTGFTSTMATRTNQTTNQETLSCCVLGSMFHCIKRGMKGAYLLRPWRLLRHGMGHQRGLHGIISTTRMWLRKCTLKAISFASIAVPHLSPKSMETIGFAPMPVSQLGAGSAGLMMRRDPVRRVETNSKSTGSGPQGPAPESALVQCVGIEPAGKSDVYCLEVPSTRAFAVGESGIVAHNCMRYLVMAYKKHAITQPIETDINLSARGNHLGTSY